MLMLWRKVMQIARSTTGTAVLTFIKQLVLFVMKGVTLSCKTTVGRRELLLGCAVQTRSSGSQQSLWYCLGKLGSGQLLKLKSHVAACWACLHLSLCLQASLRGRKLSDSLSLSCPLYDDGVATSGWWYIENRLKKFSAQREGMRRQAKGRRKGRGNDGAGQYVSLIYVKWPL